MTGTADGTVGQAAVQVALGDPATADETIAALATRVDAGGAAAILAREDRWRRCPAIIEKMFGNARVPMALVNEAIARSARAGVVVDGIPGFAEVAEAIAADPAATDPAQADGPFAAALQQAEQADGADTAATEEPEPEPATEPEKKKRKSPIIDFTKLKLFEKIRLATLGNAYCRQTLMRDSNRLVAMAAIRSPGITDTEVVRAAGNRALSEDVIRFIANKKEYVKMYPVKMSLVQNPKCPLAMSMRLIAHLQPEDLKTIARSRNVPSALSTAAKKLMLAREAAK